MKFVGCIRCPGGEGVHTGGTCTLAGDLLCRDSPRSHAAGSSDWSLSELLLASVMSNEFSDNVSMVSTMSMQILFNC